MSKRLGEILTVVILLAGLLYVLLPQADPHDAVIEAHERARDSLVVIAAHKLDSARTLGARVDTVLVRVGTADAARHAAAVSLPPAPPLILTPGDTNTIQFGDDVFKIPPKLYSWLKAVEAHDAGLHRLVAADSVVIAQQAVAIGMLRVQAGLATEAAQGFQRALAHSDSALADAKAQVTALRRRSRVVAIAAVVVGGVFLLRR